MLHIITNMAGLVSGIYRDVAIVANDAGETMFARPVMHPGQAVTYSILSRIPTAFRTRTDVNGTRNALAAGGHKALSAVNGEHSVGWKAERGELSLVDLIGYKHPT